MTRIVFHVHVDDVPDPRSANDVHVVLYGAGRMPDGVGRIGYQLMDATSRFGFGLRSKAFDFLTLALAVTAADTFVSRNGAPDRWSRDLELHIPLIDPGRWMPVVGKLEAALRFLSGDRWTLVLGPDGPLPPSQSVVSRRRRLIDLSRADCACLFSGGLDSYVGALDLIGQGRRPLLVSHSYPKDSQYQNRLVRRLPIVCERFAANAHPTWSGGSDVSMRTRSFNFLAYGVAAASVISLWRGGGEADLWIPENGHIALNPPLTPRRFGAHSTRTTHPFFLSEIQDIVRAVGLPVRLTNPLRHQTKGTMVRRHASDATFSALAATTVSCGKWKREGVQCGRCVPCLIRRASFFAAGLPDGTPYRADDLRNVLGDENTRDDLVSVLRAIRRSEDYDMEAWVLQAGPLPSDAEERSAYVDVFRHGMKELQGFLRASGIP
ncbi:7-cyano-7-deazaguanine synthase [Methylobacterium sp. E-016]|uniref:Qat anti-phage system QueC-like protein QatC n=1 Tax=Methylobacterium sp. E-016 TaxID=2836556 RepID=UPI001FB9C8B2|nr:Qat anti-phage system QueC-like protein QatC [Methylobacterium sp. E-016]MCJ2077664.1 7-cyano-7-deazaguanine synthase [Methylobacterium sp. E-016]